jgi:hypothetical protein
MPTLSQKFSDFIDKNIYHKDYDWSDNRMLLTPMQIKGLFQEFLNQEDKNDRSIIQ